MTYLLQASQTRAGEFIGLRRDIHRHPELAFEEHRTAAPVVRGRGTLRLGIHADME